MDLSYYIMLPPLHVSYPVRTKFTWTSALQVSIITRALRSTHTIYHIIQILTPVSLVYFIFYFSISSVPFLHKAGTIILDQLWRRFLLPYRYLSFYCRYSTMPAGFYPSIHGSNYYPKTCLRYKYYHTHVGTVVVASVVQGRTSTIQRAHIRQVDSKWDLVYSTVVCVWQAGVGLPGFPSCGTSTVIV